jgi:tetratricopeptide (TPR) repeat protein
MPTSRLNQLEQFYKDEPQDPFNLYALALEYMKFDLDKSKECFNKLLTEHSQYLPTYYHAAKLYLDLNDREQAIVIYEKGIALAKKINDAKAIRELQSAYQELLFE